MSFRIVEIDPVGDVPRLYWDTLFGAFPAEAHGDWAVAGTDPRAPAYGLAADAPIETAIALCLMTDARARPEDRLPDGFDDRRGWWGDTVDVDTKHGEAALGSRLWTLRWALRDEETRQRAEMMCREALEPLLRQRVAQRIDVRTDLPPDDPNRLDIEIRVIATVGDRPIAARYAVLWESVRNGIPTALAR